MNTTYDPRFPNRVLESDPAEEAAAMRSFELQMREAEHKSEAAELLAIPAFERLLKLTETRNSGQILKVATFLAATFNGDDFKFDLFELRAVDKQISDDMLACLDCLRWCTSDLYRLAPDGEKRVEKVIKAWGLLPQSNSTH